MSLSTPADIRRGEATGDARHASSAGRADLLHLLGLAIALVLWIVGLLYTDVGSLGQWGLLGAFPALWYVAVAMTLVLLLIEFGRTTSSSIRAGASLFTLVVMLYGSATVVESVPRLPWVYKHVAVTSYIELHGAVDPAIDIYNRWPGFFSLAAFLGEATGYKNPVAWAAWAEPIFALIMVALVVAIARTIAPNSQAGWFVGAIFAVSNWVNQNYFSPQAFAYTLCLAVLLLCLTFLRSRPRRPALMMERALTRVLFGAPALDSDPAGTGQLDGESSAFAGRRRVVAALILFLAAIIVSSHQLSPYLLVLAILPLALAGYVRPSWMAWGVALLAVGYLIPNYSYIQDHFGLFSSTDPIANATFSTVDVRSLPAGMWQARGANLLSLATLALGAVGLCRRVRRGYPRSALIVGWLMLSPAASLVVQSYGGEGRQRVFLFALPWAAMGIYWLIQPGSRANSAPEARGITPFDRGQFAIAAVIITGLLAVFLPTYFQPEVDTQVARADVAAGQWLDQHSRPGDGVIVSAPNFPIPLGAHYPNTIADTQSLSSVTALYQRNLNAPDVRRYAASLTSATGETFVIFSPQQQKYAVNHNLFSAAQLSALEVALSAEAGTVKVYDLAGTRVYRLRFDG